MLMDFVFLPLALGLIGLGALNIFQQAVKFKLYCVRMHAIMMANLPSDNNEEGIKKAEEIARKNSGKMFYWPLVFYGAIAFVFGSAYIIFMVLTY